MSGLPYLNHMYSMDENAPPADASIVFVATTPMRRSSPAREDPALNPNQPKARMKQPDDRHGDVMARDRQSACRP